MKLASKKITAIGLFLLLLHPYYLYILNTFGNFQMPLIIISFILLFIGVKKIKKKSISKVVPWIILFFIMGTRNYNQQILIITYIICLFSMIFLLNKENWESDLYKIIVFMTLPHAITTIILLFIPKLYDFIRPLIFSTSIMYEGYKTGLTGHYTTNAIYIATGFIIATSKLLVKGKHDKKNLILSIIYILALILTTKRGPLIFAMFAIFLTYVIVDKKRFAKRSIKALGMIIIIITILYCSASILPEISDVLSRFSTDGTSGRDAMYALAFKMFRENPIFGLGTGSYQIQYFYHLANDVNHLYLNTHNVYIQLLCENGILGLMFFLIASFGTLFSTIKIGRIFHENNDKTREIIILPTLTYQIFFLLYCLTENPLYDAMTYIPYFLCCTIIYAQLIKKEYTTSNSK